MVSPRRAANQQRRLVCFLIVNHEGRPECRKTLVGFEGFWQAPPSLPLLRKQQRNQFIVDSYTLVLSKVIECTFFLITI